MYIYIISKGDMHVYMVHLLCVHNNFLYYKYKPLNFCAIHMIIIIVHDMYMKRQADGSFSCACNHEKFMSHFKKDGNSKWIYCTLLYVVVWQHQILRLNVHRYGGNQCLYCIDCRISIS